MPTLCVISRPKNAEKSLAAVHSINYKLGEVLKKEVQCLNREEKNYACSITIDQRIITTRFRNKLSQSVGLMNYHNKLKSRFHNGEVYMNPREVKKTKRTGQAKLLQSIVEMQNKEQIRGFDSDFSLQNFINLDVSTGRPQTAVEVKSKLWGKRAETAIDRVVRAKSAPPHHWSNCDDIMAKLNCGGGGFYATKNKKRSLSRAQFHEVFDIQDYNKFREKELERQTRCVKSFIKSVETLKLAPWYPGPPRKKDHLEVIVEDMTNRPKRSSFITKTGSYT